MFVAVIDNGVDAEQWLKENSPDVALVDLQLRDGLCIGRVEILKERDIPFFICSGRPIHDDDLPRSIREAA